MKESPFSFWTGVILGLGSVAVLLGMCLLLRALLRRLWVQTYRPAVAMRRWLVLLAVAVTVFLLLDWRGYELVRRVGASAHVALLDAGAANPKAPYGNVFRGELMPVHDITGYRFPGSADVHFSLDFGPGQCLIVNGRRMVVGPRFGQGWLCRPVEDDVPLTVWRLIDPAGSPVGAVDRVSIECDVPPRRVCGPWYEVANSTEELGNCNTLRVLDNKHFPYTMLYW